MNLEQLKAGVNNSKDVSLCGGLFRLRVLSEAELLQCRADALKDAVRTGQDDEGTMVTQVLRQLYLALDDGEGKRPAASFGQFTRLITRAEREYLVDEYLSLERECSPALETMTEDEFNGILDGVKKSPDLFLNVSNTDLLRRLARYLENLPPS
jgi:hypothetical protein